MELASLFQYLQRLYSYRKKLFHRLDRAGNFVEQSNAASYFHHKCSESGDHSSQIDESQVELKWQKNIQNMKNCPFSEDGVLSCYAREIWSVLITNEVVREFLIYFLYRQEVRPEPEDLEDSNDEVSKGRQTVGWFGACRYRY